ncbi:MAG: GspH/FimT family pseudopilin [Candidatus Omnitrophota bacterium]
MGEKRRSYSFIEVLFVVIVIAVLAAIAVPRLGLGFAVKMKVKTAAQRLVSDLRLTRRLAITNNQDYKLSVDSSAKEYSIYDSSETQTGVTRTLDSTLTISADKDFIFESLGNASSTSDTSISLSADGNQADITVTVATGMAGVSGP